MDINKDYTWDYLTPFETYKNIGVNSQYGGNILGFVNDLDSYNLECFYSPLDN